MILPDMHAREFAWADSDFTKVQELIYKRAGISLHDGKHAMVYSRLSRRLRETGCNSFKEYLRQLENVDCGEWQEFINALTTNLTSFFREQHHFHLLHDYLSTTRQRKSWRIWCSAASTGEEPYSIMMTMVKSLETASNFSMVASDIDSKVLKTASQGVYRLDDLKNIESTELRYFFDRGKGLNGGMVRIKPEFKSRIEFIPINLIQNNWPFKEAFDIVFCRNVMIYFDNPTQRAVLERIHRVMVPGGLLFVGHAENFSESRDIFTLKGKTVYERR